EWIEIDLLENKLIGGIATGARTNYPGIQYVKTYNIQHRKEGANTWVNYTDSSEKLQTFEGNHNGYETVLNELPRHIFARYVRLLPLTFQQHPTLRWELLECTKSKLTAKIAAHPTSSTFRYSALF
ncbi:hypothetical protein CAPTEDRAFT_134778, partial [Capitella teleta]